MPVYEYECRQCGEISAFVEELGSGRIVARKCAMCGARSLRKVISQTVYHPEVTLEDLGVNVVRRPASQMSPEPQHQGPPGGKCPYCDAAPDEGSGKPEK